jgi:uncharacterized protein
VSVHHLSRQDARRIAVRAQLLDAPRPTHLLDVVRQLTLLQMDMTDTVAPNADLVAWSRLGSSYPPIELDAALETRALVELRGMIRPGEDLSLYRAEMEQWRRGELTGWEKSAHDWLRANDRCRRDILERLTDEGPLTARELPDSCEVPWRSSGWNNNRNVNLMLEMMERSGEVAVAAHRGRERLWDVAGRIYPDVAAVPIVKALRLRKERRLRALGIARVRATATPGEPNDVGDVGDRAVVEGIRGEWRVDPEQLGQPFTGRVALLSPLDRLVFDRKRMEELFEFDYQLEMYKPAAKRRWGYFALPILCGDNLVGKVDATADRKARVLWINALHEDVALDQAMTESVNAEIEDLAVWLRLDLDWSR